jgi:predicted O-methyltransferase YrrM
MKFSVIFHDHTKQSLGRIFNEVGIPRTVIEIGAFEGETTCNFAAFLRQCGPFSYYVIDPFTASENLKQPVLDEAKRQFLDNAAAFPEVELIEKTSLDGLIDLRLRGVKADLIYVDGSHFAKDVLLDAALGFELLNKDGVMLFDDAVSWRYGDSIHDSPKQAVDAFIACNWNRLRVLETPTGYQVAIQRTC